MGKLRIKTPAGYLVCEVKGTKDEYLGVYVGLSKDGCEDYQMIACVEYDTGSDEFKIETYCSEYDEPTHIISYDDGHDLM